MPDSAPALDGRLPRIVHLGPGAFFRAFVVPWVAEAGGWDVIGISLRSAATRDALRPQGFDYTTLELGPEGEVARRVTALRDLLVAPEDPEAALDLLADDATRIVGLTVTEKGYCHDPATGRLNPDHPDIRHDARAAAPRSAPGILVRALARRRDAGRAPFTVLSCDNLPGNGALLRGVVIEFARGIDAGLADWIAAEVAFPSTMVDRIVPGMSGGDPALAGHAADRPGAAPVLHEPYRQWVIEDDFPQGRPGFEAVGVRMVEDVAPFEAMKLRMLNGTHSALAYLGCLAGHRTVSDAVSDPAFAALCRHLWAREIAPSLTPPDGVDLAAYAEALMARYRNPAIRHFTSQIAMDGSQKLPPRILRPLSDGLDAGRGVDGLLLVVAGWMRYVAGVDEAGRAHEVHDPLADRLRAAAGGGVADLLSVREVFDPALAARIEAPLHEMHAALVVHAAREMAGRVAR